MLDEHAAVVVFHGCQQTREHHRGIRSPVAVMPTVQLVRGPVNGNVQSLDATRAKYNLLAAALMHGTIADQPDIAAQRVLVGGNDVSEVPGAGFFLAFEDKSDIGLKRDMGRT